MSNATKLTVVKSLKHTNKLQPTNNCTNEVDALAAFGYIKTK